MAGPDHRIPTYSRREDWTPDADDVARAARPPEDVALRALSVVPFVLVAALGVIALVGWVIVIVFGVSAPGNAASEPVWRWAQGQSFGHVVGQLALAVGIGLIPVAVIVAGSWATIHGFRQDPHPLFWPAWSCCGVSWPSRWSCWTAAGRSCSMIWASARWTGGSRS